MKNIILIGLILLSIGCKNRVDEILDKSNFKHYITDFNLQDTLDLHFNAVPNTKMISNDDSWSFLEDNIPFFECPDKEIEEVYYYRWWTFRKHIKSTPEGYVITEFMANVPWAEKYNTIPCPAGHHFREGRWLHNPKIISDYGTFWLRGGGNPYRYSFWISDSYLRYHMVHPNDSLLIDVLPDLVANYNEWENRRLEPDGLFWQVDGQDGMEVAIGGHGKRPTINTYMFADAMAISWIAGLSGGESSELSGEKSSELSFQFSEKAEGIRQKVLDKLWDTDDQFFKVMPRGTDSLSSARELLGYVPWYLNLPPKNQGYEVAWKQLMDPEGFYAPFGPTTAEQRHPGFRINYTGHECQWNGPSWPFATSQTLTALANVLNDYPQDVIDKVDFFETLKIYTNSHRFRQIPPKGDTIVSDYLWIPDDWDWFCLDDILYKGHKITIVWDKTGKKYHQGKGFSLYLDGKLVVNTAKIQRIEASLL